MTFQILETTTSSFLFFVATDSAQAPKLPKKTVRLSRYSFYPVNGKRCQVFYSTLKAPRLCGYIMIMSHRYLPALSYNLHGTPPPQRQNVPLLNQYLPEPPSACMHCIESLAVHMSCASQPRHAKYIEYIQGRK